MQGLPLIAVVEGDKNSRFRARKKQPFARRILANGIGVASPGDARRDFLPAFTAVASPIVVRAVIIQPVAVHGSVNGARVVTRGHEHANFTPWGEGGRSDVVPGLAGVARELNQAVVGAHPNFARVERGGRDGVNDSAALSSGRVGSGRWVECIGNAGVLPREVGAQDLPGIAAVGSPEEHLRSKIELVRIEG